MYMVLWKGERYAVNLDWPDGKSLKSGGGSRENLLQVCSADLKHNSHFQFNGAHTATNELALQNAWKEIRCPSV